MLHTFLSSCIYNVKQRLQFIGIFHRWAFLISFPEYFFSLSTTFLQQNFFFFLHTLVVSYSIWYRVNSIKNSTSNDTSENIIKEEVEYIILRQHTPTIFCIEY